MRKITYGKQYINKDDLLSVKRSLLSEKITTGNYLKEFEKKLSNFLKCKFSIACNSGTSALHLSFLSINLKKNDIVIMPAINFVASYSLCKNLGAKVFLADVDPLTGQMKPENLLECIKRNNLKKIKLVITMYLGGKVEDNFQFFNLKKKFDFYLIEDACHALGSKYIVDQKKFLIGSAHHSDLTVFSLHPLKTITTGEGGVICTNNKIFAKKINLLKSHCILRSNEHWKYDVVDYGFNYRLSDINAALGISQLKKMNSFIKKRLSIVNFYKKKFSKIKNINIPNSEYDHLYAWHLYILNINFKKIGISKDYFIKYMLKKGIICQYHYIPLYKFKIYRGEKKLHYFKGSENYYKNSVSIPIHVNLNIKDLNSICKEVIKISEK
jgi:dTDP-4-amino-4,6-dideoxygalactose transaminase